jgi:hypothetical protein
VCRGWEQETQKLADTALHVTFLRAKQWGNQLYFRFS